MATEQFPEASQLLTQLWQYAREHELKSRYNSIFKKEVALDFAQHQYAAVIEKINGEGADIKSKNLDMLRIKASQQMGDEKVIPQWLEANVQYQSDKNNMLKMYWLDFQNYYLAFHF